MSGAWGSSPDRPETPPSGGTPPPETPPPGSPTSPPPSAQWEVGAPSAPRQKTSGLAVASLVTGLFFWCFAIPGIIGIVLGFLALEQIADSDGQVKGRGMAIAGIVLGYVGLGIVGVAVVAWVVSILA